jgi:hypothetical protein
LPKSNPRAVVPLRRFERPERCRFLVTEKIDTLSWGWLGLQRMSSTKLATLWVLRSLSGLGFHRPWRFSLHRVLREVSSFPERSALDLSLPSRETLRKPSSRG